MEININVEHLQKSLNLLADNPNIMINELKKDDLILNAYLHVKDVVSKFHRTKYYSIITNLIDELYRPTILYPGTIGAFIWGCFSNYYGNVNQNCSVLCLDSIPSTENTTICHYQIWKYSGDKLRKISKSNNNQAYIYVGEDWKGFSKDEISLLENNNVIYATILDTNNSKHNVKISMSSLDEIPIRDKDLIESDIERNRENINYIYIIILGIILISIILIKYKEIIKIEY